MNASEALPVAEKDAPASEEPAFARTWPAAVRYPVLALTWLLLKPALWVIDKAGWSEPLWLAVGRRMRDTFIRGHDFGDYRPTGRDVVVCACPKAGQNWTMQIAFQIATRGAGEFRHIHEVVPWPDWAKQDMVVPLRDERAWRAAPTGLRVIKTHLEWDRLPYRPEARYICVLRDPKDAFVSSYFFIRDVIFGPLMPPVPVWLRMFCEGTMPFSWSAHVDGAWKHRHLPNVLVLTYEDMQKDLPAAVRTIAAFMGVALTRNEFARVCEKSSFASMQEVNHKFTPPALSPWAATTRWMMRRGVSGGSSELLSTGQQRVIDDHCRADLRRLGSDFPYDEVWGAASPVPVQPAAAEGV